ncbi:NAD(+) diphosphatase [Corynebacterium hindlerae]|uniref:NAD(+) diphosphatase n=1 Tax=Corynebacterium hindlerae TaxID=699041 RepID=UPI001FCBF185|nr:NUDIX domain-containing protein [Corynebacterium hindlerae]
MSLLFVTPDYRILVDAQDQPLWLPLEAVDEQRYAAAIVYAPLADDPEQFHTHASVGPSFPYVAVRATDTEIEELPHLTTGTWRSARGYLDHPNVASVIAKLRFRENERFDSQYGSPLHHFGSLAFGHDQRMIYPRIDPSVIGIVELYGHNKILLGRNRLRPDYFSLIAGYVNPGETLEAAFAREVLEETGRRADNITYVRSQPWPMSGSLMIGFTASTTDEDPVSTTDGELEEIVWAGPEQIRKLPLAAPGSIARQLIDDWAKTHQ